MRHTVYGKRRAVYGEGLGESEQGEGAWILRGSIKPLHGLPELGPDRIQHREQRHTGAEFHVIGGPEDLARRPAAHRIDRGGADPQALTQHRVLQVGTCLVKRPNRLLLERSPT